MSEPVKVGPLLFGAQESVFLPHPQRKRDLRQQHQHQWFGGCRADTIRNQPAEVHQVLQFPSSSCQNVSAAFVDGAATAREIDWVWIPSFLLFCLCFLLVIVWGRGSFCIMEFRFLCCCFSLCSLPPHIVGRGGKPAAVFPFVSPNTVVCRGSNLGGGGLC